MISSKIAALCLVGFVLLANYIEARPAPEEEHKHVHHVHKEAPPGEHVHHVHRKVHPEHVRHHKEGGGEPHVHRGGGGGGAHVHHYSIGGGGGGAGGAGGADGGIGGDLNINAGGGGGGGGLGALGNLNLKGFSPETIKTFKKMLGNLNVDLSQLDLGDLNLGGGGAAGGAAGGAGGAAGGGGIHKFDGKDSLQPAICDDSINDRYGVGKHFVRGVRDVGAAIVSEAEDLLDPLLGGLTQGVGQGLKALLCAIENGFSDFGSDFDSATDIAKHGLVNFFKLQGPHPVLGIPVGIAGIAGEAVKAAASIGGDAIGGIGHALNEIVTNLRK
ncbi:unnamed protein product [Larinioides sclopetarius]|uniref:Uncharacterized protein n=1 Tax=Larinioides sclopetarius TaxID=280406 RepID=A0AAV1ZT76_9ARAC